MRLFQHLGGSPNEPAEERHRSGFLYTNMSNQLNKIIGAFFLVFAINITGCTEKTPEEMITSAKASIEKSDYKSAVIDLKAALQKEPQNAEARLLLGQAHHVQGEYDAAAKEYQQAQALGIPSDNLLPLYGRLLIDTHQYQKTLEVIKVVPTLGNTERAVVHAYRAHALLKLNRKDEASKELAEAEILAPQHPEVMIVKSLYSVLGRDLDAALKFTELALRQNPRHLEALLNKAALQALTNKNEEALKTYREIVRVAPYAFEAYLGAARLHMAKQDLTEADNSIKAAERLAPRSPKVRVSRALLEVRRGNFSAAQQALNEAIKVIPDDPSTLLLHAIASLAQGHYEQGRKSAERLLAVQPGHPIATKILAEIHLKTGQAASSLTLLNPLLRQYPQDTGLLLLMAQAHTQLGAHAAALQYLEKAAALAPDNLDVRLQRASVLIALGQDQTALTELDRLAAADTHGNRADLPLINLQIKHRQFDDALISIARLERKQPNNPTTHYLRGLTQLGKNDIMGARASLQQALNLDPTLFHAVAMLARLDLMDNKPADARKRYEAVLARDPKHLQAMLAIAELAAYQRQEQEYRQWLERAAQAHPKAIEPRALLARHHTQRKEHSRALAIAQEAVNNNPGDANALKLLAATQHSAGDRDKALLTLASLVKSAPDSADAHYTLGAAQLAAGRNREGRASLQRAISLQPDFIPALDALIVLESAEGRFDVALQLAKQMQTGTPGRALGYVREGDIHFARQQLGQAAQAYRRAVERDAGSDVFIKLHRTLSLAGDAKAADQALRSWLERRPEDIAVRIYAADQLFAEGRLAEAIRLYEAVLQRQPGHVGALNNLAELYRRSQDGRALPTAEWAYQLAPGRPEVLDTYGWLLVEAGRVKEALPLMRRAAEKAPGDLSIQYRLAVAHARNGSKAEARNLLERILATGRPFPERDQARALLGQL